MCGLTGFVDCLGRITDAGQQLQNMTESLSHRGPDDDGLWLDQDAGLGLGHRRLAIIDLSPEGHQPMHSASGRYVMVYNGEVYNYRQLRAELEQTGAAFRGHSDTEVMLAAIERWGLTDALSRFVGMFGLALWDRHTRVLRLVRDRVGIKPLYYGFCGGVFLFGSELKALRAHASFRADIDRGALALYTRFNCIPAPHTIYAGISKLQPGCVLTLGPPPTAGCLPEPRIEPYWTAHAAVESGLANPLSCAPEEAVDRLESLLGDAVALRMEADVPLGAFLSGGIDSSLVAALMQSRSSQAAKTFSIGFDAPGYDEAGHARAVAAHLGTQHTELYLSAGEAMEMIPELPAVYDEPFSDSSQIPTLLVSRLAREHVTVSLSGDGGDELFCGYNRYVWGRRVWRRTQGVPLALREAGATALTALSPAAWDRLLQPLMQIAPRRLRAARPGDNIHKLASVLGVRSADELYGRLVSHCADPASAVIGGVEPESVLSDENASMLATEPVLRMMYLDLISYLPDDTLTKLDRASMHFGLEARVPLLDHRVVEFAWRLPLALKLHQGQGKWILRRLLRRHLPEDLFERPKMGFGIPIGDWLRGPLREWCEALIAPQRLREEGYFEPSRVRGMWAEHLSGRRNRAYDLWDVLMFQAWLERQRV